MQPYIGLILLVHFNYTFLSIKNMHLYTGSLPKRQNAMKSNTCKSNHIDRRIEVLYVWWISGDRSIFTIEIMN